MKLPNVVHEYIQNPIDDDHITRFILGQKKKHKGKGAASSREPQTQPPPQLEPHIEPLAAFDMASYAQWQYQCNTQTWDMLAATNCANTYFQQSQYLMQQQAGYPLEIMEQFMTPQAFQTHVAWPEVRPNPYGRGGAFGAEDENEDVMEYSDTDDPDKVPSETSCIQG